MKYTFTYNTYADMQLRMLNVYTYYVYLSYYFSMCITVVKTRAPRKGTSLVYIFLFFDSVRRVDKTLFTIRYNKTFP